MKKQLVMCLFGLPLCFSATAAASSWKTVAAYKEERTQFRRDLKKAESSAMSRCIVERWRVAASNDHFRKLEEARSLMFKARLCRFAVGQGWTATRKCGAIAILHSALGLNPLCALSAAILTAWASKKGGVCANKLEAVGIALAHTGGVEAGPTLRAEARKILDELIEQLRGTNAKGIETVRELAEALK